MLQLVVFRKLSRHAITLALAGWRALRLQVLTFTSAPFKRSVTLLHCHFDCSISAIVSQSDVVAFLHKHVEQLGPLADASLAQLGLADKAVVCVPGEMSAIHAFASMVVSACIEVCVVYSLLFLLPVPRSTEPKGLQKLVGATMIHGVRAPMPRLLLDACTANASTVSYCTILCLALLLLLPGQQGVLCWSHQPCTWGRLGGQPQQQRSSRTAAGALCVTSWPSAAVLDC
jgi:hypothetical protein